MENNDNLGSNPPEKENFDMDLTKARGLWENIRVFISELLDIRADTDRESTVEAIKKDISFKGHNAWILIFSIFVASIGLNVGSAAVVIGAMLISPLMGPIVGIGLSVAINDVRMLKRSFINLGVMVFLSVLTATFYFFISPIKIPSPEIIARTYPTILDVLVAIFGGLALIVAKTKKGTIASVIFGVAIATALMPPLCTVGYGLATGNMPFASGALYLFSINAVFIALSTFLVSKLLGFPLVKYANQQRRRRIAQIATAIAIVIMIPSVILFVNLLRKQVFISTAEEYLAKVIKYQGTETIKYEEDFKKREIEVYLIGNVVPDITIQTWREALSDFEALKGSKLIIHQGTNESGGDINLLSSQVKSGILEDLYLKNQEVIENKDAQISFLEKELLKYKQGDFSFEEISRELKINYQDVENLTYANTISTNFKKIDTIPTFNVTWDSRIRKADKITEVRKIEKWLALRLKLDTLLVRSLN
ncbi:putative hydrophobic protein (TIGR00271 family) [Gillisia mitskevichiae]|uniref:Putative hydrophobic protein (TIGR00271 family) n=1 Tax=Gillisia mitskevichiae TaxID=270921 RepID=A0A495P3Y0_9FLAO|nr:DUF389 domain-containing protein [Gillisia mitskevichiae]RKS44917.1 putative hydrophobic protein (TIGR00271 family) [Gillisia mitskevichiae]